MEPMEHKSNNGEEENSSEEKTYWQRAPRFKKHPTVKEFEKAHDQACDIVQDAINVEERKLAETAKDPWTKRCLERSDKKT